MDARQMIEDDIKTSMRKGIKLGILINPRISGCFFSDRLHISSQYSMFSDELDFRNKYSQNYEDGKYLVALKDGAYFQVNYEFKIKRKRDSYVKKMNYCFIPSIIDNSIVNEYLRVDFNHTNDNSFFHSFAHLHVGFKNCIRIPMDEVMLFSEFLLMILYYYYPEDFKTFVNNENIYKNTVDDSVCGKFTENRVLSRELEKYLYIKTVQ